MNDFFFFLAFFADETNNVMIKYHHPLHQFSKFNNCLWDDDFQAKIFPILLPKIVLIFHCLNVCSSDLKKNSNSRPSASNFKSFSRSLEQFFLTVRQNNFGNKIPIHYSATKCKKNLHLFLTT